MGVLLYETHSLIDQSIPYTVADPNAEEVA